MVRSVTSACHLTLYSVHVTDMRIGYEGAEQKYNTSIAMLRKYNYLLLFLLQWATFHDRRYAPVHRRMDLG